MSLHDKRSKFGPSVRLSRIEARKRMVEIAKEGVVRFSSHAREEMKNDDLDSGDVLNILLSPDARILKEPEFERGTYRYCVETHKMAGVVAFSDENSLVIVTAWRKRK